MNAFSSAIAAIAAPLCLLAACTTTGMAHVRAVPAIPELASIRRLGIAACTPRLAENEHVLRRTDGGLFDPVDLEGVSHLVALLSPSPDAASRFSVTPASLAASCRRIWVKEVGSAHAFDGETGPRGDGQRAAGLEEVKGIGDPGVCLDASQEEMRALAACHGVEALLVVEPSVYAEVGYVTEQESGSPFGKDIPVGSFLLRTVISYAFALFSAETGNITTSLEMPGVALPGAETCLFDLGPMTSRQLLSFMNTEDYAELFEQALREALKPLLPLFGADCRPRD
ncbi:MAG: hypothetical protein ABSG63_17315 [Spirochaetia bacterium]|jgi:hypothetical protein